MPRTFGTLRLLHCLLHLLDQLADLFGGREPIIGCPHELGLDALQEYDPVLDLLSLVDEALIAGGWLPAR